MPEKVREVDRPSGISRFFYRLPVYLYRIGLGGLMGKRFLLLEHIGRVSGKRHKTVIEVVRADEPAGRYYVVSAWGERSDWYRNLQAHPEVQIQVGWKKYRAVAHFLEEDDIHAELLDYARRHTTAAQQLAKLMGYRVDGTPEDFALLAKDLRMAVFAVQGPA